MRLSPRRSLYNVHLSFPYARSQSTFRSQFAFKVSRIFAETWFANAFVPDRLRRGSVDFVSRRFGAKFRLTTGLGPSGRNSCIQEWVESRFKKG
jgi:hypothetical protein